VAWCVRSAIFGSRDQEGFSASNSVHNQNPVQECLDLMQALGAQALLFGEPFSTDTKPSARSPHLPTIPFNSSFIGYSKT
jgi:hypothetical protein